MDKQTRALVVGGLLLLVNIGIGVTGVVDGIIEGTVADMVSDGYDGLDEDGNENYSSDYDDEWHVSTAERVYFANSVTDPEALESENPADGLTMMGPFIYNVTTTRDIIDFDYDANTMTYSEYDVFEWCSECTWTDDDGVEHASVSGDTNVTQVNILWNTQRIGGMGGATGGIFYGETFAKAMFAAGMVEFDLSNRAPSIWASEDIDGMINAFSLSLQAMGMDEVNASILAPSGILSGVYSGVDASTDDILNNTEMFFPYAETILYDAEDPSTGECIALTCDLGPVLVAGMGAPDGGEVTQTRATLYGYGSADAATMASVDATVFGLAASKFVEHGGGAEINNETPQLKERFHEMSGLLINDPATLNTLLFDPNVGMMGSFEISGIPLPGMVIGLLLPLQSGSYFDAMVTYGIGLLAIADLADYVEPWVGLGVTGPARDFEMILMGGQGTMNSDDWWHTSFGAADPLAGEYIPIGLNRDTFAGMADLTMEQSNFILNDPEIGLKSSFPSVFMYGELSGMSLPDVNGNQYVWDDAYVASLYDSPEDAASALRDWVSNFYFDTVMPVLLNFVTGNEPFTTQPVNHWLYGWNDAVNDYFGFFPWVSLETNDTYYGSISEENPEGVSTGDRSVYMMSTAGDNIGQRLAQGYINSDGNGLCDYDYDAEGNFLGYDLECESGQVYGMTEHLPWRAPHRENAALGLLSDHVGNDDTVVAGTVGGIADSESSFNVNLIGYAIAQSEVGSETTYKGIDMVEHTVTLDPASAQIQGKLIGSATFVDAMPGALPVYLGANIDMKVEPITNAPMYGKVTATFYLDLRGPGSMNPDFNSNDVVPVFEIHSFSDIPDDSADSFRGSVSDNLGFMGWTNFGGDAGAPLSIVHAVIALIYVAAVGLIVYGMMGSRDK
ncbi:MAG: hypothetical protein VYC60_04225 [Candidatus Thermoplasmatota archaeon]|nr:hypothetical protein [Candidatus Thermoplasmatota archaeon]